MGLEGDTEMVGGLVWREVFSGLKGLDRRGKG